MPIYGKIILKVPISFHAKTPNCTYSTCQKGIGNI
jgi:hypothetical protein